MASRSTSTLSSAPGPRCLNPITPRAGIASANQRLRLRLEAQVGAGPGRGLRSRRPAPLRGPRGHRLHRARAVELLRAAGCGLAPPLPARRAGSRLLPSPGSRLPPFPLPRRREPSPSGPSRSRSRAAGKRRRRRRAGRGRSVGRRRRRRCGGPAEPARSWRREPAARGGPGRAAACGAARSWTASRARPRAPP